MRTTPRDAEPGAKEDDRTVGAGTLPARAPHATPVGQAGHTQGWQPGSAKGLDQTNSWQ